MNSQKRRSEPTPDDIARRLRPIRADYVRQVRKLAKEQRSKKGCKDQGIAILLIVGASGAILYELGKIIMRMVFNGLKRDCAQALNNMAKAVLSIQPVYEAFKDVHPEHEHYLEALLIEQAQVRERLVAFVALAWYLNEEQVMHYL